jgi:hypothetical protein
MIIQEHTKSLIFMLIIKLEQQVLILEKSWMRKYEISYHEKTNTIEFISEFCTHSKRIETDLTNKEEKISFEKKSFSNQSNHVEFDTLTKNSTKLLMIVIKIIFRKEVKPDQSAINLFRKDKKSTKFINKIRNSKTTRDIRFNLNELEIFNSKEKKSLSMINIAMIKASAFNIMSKRKNVSLFFVTLKNVEKHLEKHSKSNIVIKDVLSFEYHEFLNVFDKKALNTLVFRCSYNYKSFLKRMQYRIISHCTSCSKKSSRYFRNISRTISKKNS